MQLVSQTIWPPRGQLWVPYQMDLMFLENTIWSIENCTAAAVAFVNAFGNCAQVSIPDKDGSICFSQSMPLTDDGQIWTTYLYDGGAPRYVLAMSVNSGFALVGVALAMFMRLVLVRENEKLALAESQDNDGEGEANGHIEPFRYVT